MNVRGLQGFISQDVFRLVAGIHCCDSTRLEHTFMDYLLQNIDRFSLMNVLGNQVGYFCCTLYWNWLTMQGCCFISAHLLVTSSKVSFDVLNTSLFLYCSYIANWLNIYQSLGKHMSIVWNMKLLFSVGIDIAYVIRIRIKNTRVAIMPALLSVVAGYHSKQLKVTSVTTIWHQDNPRVSVHGNDVCTHCCTGIILPMGSANERQRYNVTPSLIGSAHSQNNPCCNDLFIKLNIPIHRV